MSNLRNIGGVGAPSEVIDGRRSRVVEGGCSRWDIEPRREKLGSLLSEPRRDSPETELMDPRLDSVPCAQLRRLSESKASGGDLLAGEVVPGRSPYRPCAPSSPASAAALSSSPVMFDAILACCSWGFGPF